MQISAATPRCPPCTRVSRAHRERKGGRAPGGGGRGELNAPAAATEAQPPSAVGLWRTGWSGQVGRSLLSDLRGYHSRASLTFELHLFTVWQMGRQHLEAAVRLLVEWWGGAERAATGNEVDLPVQWASGGARIEGAVCRRLRDWCLATPVFGRWVRHSAAVESRDTSSTCCQWSARSPQRVGASICCITLPSVVSRSAVCMGGGGQWVFRGRTRSHLLPMTRR